MDEAEKEHLEYKQKVLDNLDLLKSILVDCEDEGLNDPDSTIYNQLVDLIDEAEALEKEEELDLIVYRAKIIEKDVDEFLSRNGRSSISIDWPALP